MDTPEQAAELVSIIECNAGEPDAIVKALAPVYRQAEAERDSCRDILWYMLKAAFNASAAHGWAFEEYLAAIEEGREPSEEAVARFASQREAADQPEEPKVEVEVIHGSTILLMGGNGTQLFRLDLGETEQRDKAVELYVLDEKGARAHSVVVREKAADTEV